MTRPEIEPWSPGPLANILPYIYIRIKIFCRPIHFFPFWTKNERIFFTYIYVHVYIYIYIYIYIYTYICNIMAEGFPFMPLCLVRILGDLKKSVELKTRLRMRRVDFRCSQRTDEFARYGRRTRWGWGR